MVKAMAAKRKGQETGKKPVSAKQSADKKQPDRKPTPIAETKQGASQKTTDKEPKPNKEAKANERNGHPATHIIQFLKEVDVERRKITWPDRTQILRETWGVLILVALITLLVLGFDWAVAKFVFVPLEHFVRLHGGGFGHSM
jgi:preprotein translocase subunit SecE